MTYQNRIEGTFNLTTPLHCAGTGGVADAEGNENTTRIQSERVITPNGVQWIPFFPGNDLRGRLRRKAAHMVLASIGKVSPDLYTGLMAGAVGAKPESDLTVEEALRAKANPYMGLFGGGTRMLRSRYQANDLVPVLHDTIAMGRVPAAFGELNDEQFLPTGPNGPLTGRDIKSRRTSFRVNDIIRMTDATGMQNFIENAVDAVAAKQIEILGGNANRKADKAALKAGEIKANDVVKKSDVSNMFDYEYIVPGTPMYCLLDIENDATDQHVCLLLLSLLALVREQGLGGWVRIGFGRFTANLTLTRNDQKYQIFMEGKNAANAELTEEVFEAFCQPALNAIAKLSVQDMAEFYLARTEEIDGSASRKTKAKNQEVAA